MWELDVCSEGKLYMGMIHQPKKEIRRKFKIFVVVLTNPQRRTSLHMLQIRKRHPIPSLLSLALKTLKKASRVSKLITLKSYQKFHLVLIFYAINFMVVFPRDNMFLHKIIAWKFSGVEHDKVLTISSKNLEEKFGPSFAFVASTFLESGGVPQPANANALLKEAIHVISCGYEDKSDWGKEVSSR
jgi:hypothetical protein